MGTIEFPALQTTDTPLVTTAETVVVTLTGVTTPRKTNVFLKGWCKITTGTNTTAVVLRIRRGGLTGTVIGESDPITIGAAAGSNEEFEIEVLDGAIDLGSATYVLTASQTGASANGTCLTASLSASMSE